MQQNENSSKDGPGHEDGRAAGAVVGVGTDVDHGEATRIGNEPWVLDICDPKTGRQFVLDIGHLQRLPDTNGEQPHPEICTRRQAVNEIPEKIDKPLRSHAEQTKPKRKVREPGREVSVVRLLTKEGLGYRGERYYDRDAVTLLLSQLGETTSKLKRCTSGFPVSAAFRSDKTADGTEVIDLSETSVFCPSLGDDVILPNVRAAHWQKSKK